MDEVRFHPAPTYYAYIMTHWVKFGMEGMRIVSGWCRSKLFCGCIGKNYFVLTGIRLS
jgi:hypothetical protein